MTTLRPWLLASLAAAAAVAAAGQAQAARGELGAFGTRAEVSGFIGGGPGAFTASKHYSYYGGGSGAGGLAYASLASGALHAADTAIHESCDELQSYCGYVGLDSKAAMWDTVTFYSRDGGPLQVLSLLPLSIVVDGTLQGPFAYAKMRSYIGPDRDLDPNSLDWVDLSTGKTELLDNVVMPLNEAPLFVYVEISTGATTNGEVSTSAEADFGHTLHFNWVLPDDVTAVSASGVFLTDLSAAPEPASWTLMLAGFGAAGALLRARRGRLA